jgi:hypothetical protein
MDQNSLLFQRSWDTSPSKPVMSPSSTKQDRRAADEHYILRILSDAKDPLFPSEITARVNYELMSGTPYSMTEVAIRLMNMDSEVDQLPDGRWALKRRMD